MGLDEPRVLGVEPLDPRGAGRPQRHAHRPAQVGSDAREEAVALRDVDAVDVDVVVPVVERGLDRPRAAAAARAPTARRRRSARSGRAPAAARSSAAAERRIDVERAPARVAVAADRARSRSRSPASRRRRCARAARRPARDEASGPRRAAARPRPRPAAPRTTCRSRRGTRTARSPSTDGRRSPGRDGSTSCCGIVENIASPGRGEVVVDRVAIRVVGHRAVLADRADADHVRQRGGVVREVPRRRRRLRAVPDRRDDDDALRVRVLDRRLLERRVRVELGSSGSRTPPRLRLITRAPLSTAQRIAATSPASETFPSGADDLRDHQLRVEREARRCPRR